MKNSLLVKFSILILFLLIMIFAGIYFDIKSMLSLEAVRSSIEQSRIAPILFMGIYIIAAFVFLPSTPLTIVAGFIFGAALGTLYVVLASLIASILAFTLARILGEGYISKLLKDKFPKLEAYHDRLIKHGFLTVFILRFIPIFPLNGLNMALGVTKISAKDFFLATFLGIIPGSFVFAYFGSSLETMNLYQISLSLTLIAIVSVIAFWYARMTHMRSKNQYDVIIIGAKSLPIADKLQESGLKVLFVSPSKEQAISVLFTNDIVDEIARVLQDLIIIQKWRENLIDKDFLKSKLQKIYSDAKQLAYEKWEKIDIDHLFGQVQFLNKNTIQIQGNAVSARYFVIDQELLEKKEDIHQIKTIRTLSEFSLFPEKMTIIANVIEDIEMAYFFHLLGKKINIVYTNHFFSYIGKSAFKILEALLEQDQIKFIKDSDIHAIDSLLFSSYPQEYSLNKESLQKAKIQKDVFEIDSQLRTNNKQIFVRQHTQDHEIIVYNILSILKKKKKFPFISAFISTTFARFGYTEELLELNGHYFETVELVDEKSQQKYKIYIGEKDFLLGGYGFGKDALFVLKELQNLQEMKLSFQSVLQKDTCHKMVRELAKLYMSKKKTLLSKNSKKYLFYLKS